MSKTSANKVRGFEVVKDSCRKNKEKVTAGGKQIEVMFDITLPQRSDVGSAGYDFYAPRDIMIHPMQKMIIWTDVKAYMGEHEVLIGIPRSSMGIKKGLMLSNTLGVIDTSYYENEDNDGNIGFSLLNTSGKAIEIKSGERFVQGIFVPYLVSDNGNPDEGVSRIGGMGSSGE